MVCIWALEGNLWEQVLPSNHVFFGSQFSSGWAGSAFTPELSCWPEVWSTCLLLPQNSFQPSEAALSAVAGTAHLTCEQR